LPEVADLIYEGMMVYDLVLKKEKIIDGPGNRWFSGEEEPSQFSLVIKCLIFKELVVVSEARHTDTIPGEIQKCS